jgi:hypothetical protein
LGREAISLNSLNGHFRWGALRALDMEIDQIPNQIVAEIFFQLARASYPFGILDLLQPVEVVVSN